MSGCFWPVGLAGADPSEALRHSLAGPFVEAESTLVSPRCSQFRRQVSVTHGAPPEPGVVRAVPRDIAEGCEGHPAVPAGAGQLLGGSKEGRSDAVPGVVRVDADLLDVRIAVEYLQPDETEGPIPLVHGDQEPAVGESGAVGIGLRRWRVGHAVHPSCAELLLT